MTTDAPVEAQVTGLHVAPEGLHFPDEPLGLGANVTNPGAAPLAAHICAHRDDVELRCWDLHLQPFATERVFVLTQPPGIGVFAYGLGPQWQSVAIVKVPGTGEWVNQTYLDAVVQAVDPSDGLRVDLALRYHNGTLPLEVTIAPTGEEIPYAATGDVIRATVHLLHPGSAGTEHGEIKLELWELQGNCAGSCSKARAGAATTQSYRWTY